MRCQRCGNELRSGELLCSQCGAVIVDTPWNDETLSEEQKAAISSRSRSQNLNLSGIIVRIRDKQQRFKIQEIESLILGRSDPRSSSFPDFDLSPFGAEQRGVSRRHAVLRFDDGQLTVTDLESANGTRLNGQKLVPNQPFRIRDGDEIILGQLAIGISFVW